MRKNDQKSRVYMVRGITPRLILIYVVGDIQRGRDS